MEPAAPQAPAPRSDWGWALLALLVVGAAGGGALVYQLMQSGEAPPDAAGFDVQETAEGPRSNYQPLAQKRDESSLDMLKSGFEKVQFGRAATGAPPRATVIKDLVVKTEKIIEALAIRYTRQYPVIREYGKEWMSQPDLKKLNDDYFIDHDPVKFMRGLAASPSFPKLLKKYAGYGEIQSFVKDAVKSAPRGSVEEAMKIVNEEKTVKQLVDNVAQSLGLPVGMLAGAMGGGGPKVDEKAIMGSILGSHPDMQKAMDNPDVQRQLSSPDVQKRIKDATSR